MKAIPQHKVIGPNNYEYTKNECQETRYRSDKWKDAFSLLFCV